ncbi:DUF5320 family protein [Patescibacteria group bacterium]|nr:DUF5320 family protein [Patescibacteria group bacterium]
MPNYDGQGPVWGGGPGAGRGMGPCGAGYGPRGCGRGFGRGMGMGRGYRMNWTKKDELNSLDEEEKMLKEELAEIARVRKDLSSQK